MKKAQKLALVAILVTAGGVLAFVGAAPEGYKSVTDVTAQSGKYLGERVLVKATVAEGSVNRDGALTFMVAEPGAALLVEWASSRPVPEHEAGGTIEGRTVVVDGVLSERDGRLLLLASDMQVGCASKYESAEGEAAASPA